MKPIKKLLLFSFSIVFSSCTLPKLIAENPENQADASSSLPLVFSEDFELIFQHVGVLGAEEVDKIADLL